MIIEISEKKMKKVGELVFETFNEARKERKSRNLSILTATALVNDGIIPNREKIYAVWKGYSERNLQHLEQIVQDIKNGTAHFAEHNLIED